jgi:ribonuclease HI
MAKISKVKGVSTKKAAPAKKKSAKKVRAVIKKPAAAPAKKTAQKKTATPPARKDTAKDSKSFDKRYDVTIYTDGSCLGNQVGGWAAIILTAPDKVGKVVKGSASETTNGRMELQAAVEGIRAAKKLGAKRILLRPDATYVVNTINQWLETWVKNQWAGAAGTQVRNRDILEELYIEMKGVAVHARHVKAHNGDVYNEMADTVAQKESQKQAKKPDPVAPLGAVVISTDWNSVPRMQTVLDLFK